MATKKNKPAKGSKRTKKLASKKQLAKSQTLKGMLNLRGIRSF